MEKVLMNFKNGKIITFENVGTTIISGNYLIIVSKQSNAINGESNEPPLLYTTNDVVELSELNSYTVVKETKKYDNQ